MSLLIESAPRLREGAPSPIPRVDAGGRESRESSTAPAVMEALAVLDDALAAIPLDVGVYFRLSDSDVVAGSALVGRIRDRVGSVGAMLAGEIGRRSRPESGSDGLAQRNGFRTAKEMVKVVTRVSGHDASSAIAAGTSLVELSGAADPGSGSATDHKDTWLSPLAGPLAAGDLSIPAWDAIRLGLGRPDSVATADLLRDAAARLVDAGRQLDPDGLRRLARAARDEIDAAGIGVREEERRERRSLRLVTLADGMGRLSWTIDPETLATVRDVYDRATSPKLGGVRFVDGANEALNDRILGDTRTAEQLASDAFAHLLAAGSDADSSNLLGSGAPVVKVLVSLDDIADDLADDRNRIAQGWIEGSPDPVAIGTIERALEAGTTDLVVFRRDGQLVDPSELVARYGPDWRERLDAGEFGSVLSGRRGNRLFTQKQKSDLAARDGGCRWNGCGRPPSWCEAHHVEQWDRDHGATVTPNGVLLCKHHHLLLHNGGWEIRTEFPTETGDWGATASVQYWLIPPAAIDPTRTPRLMPSKSGAWLHLDNSTVK